MRINNIRRVLALLLTFMLACVPVVAMADTLTSTKEELLATIEDICFCMEESRAIKKLEVMIAIVKHIVTVKLDEQAIREKAAAKKEQRQKIMAIMAKKQDESLENASMEDLQKMLDELSE